jgi:hypothetical protein
MKTDVVDKIATGYYAGQDVSDEVKGAFIKGYSLSFRHSESQLHLLVETCKLVAKVCNQRQMPSEGQVRQIKDACEFAINQSLS